MIDAHRGAFQQKVYDVIFQKINLIYIEDLSVRLCKQARRKALFPFL